MCQRDNNPTIEQTAADIYLYVYIDISRLGKQHLLKNWDYSVFVVDCVSM